GLLHKAVYTGPQIRYLSKDGNSYLEFTNGVSFKSQIPTRSTPYTVILRQACHMQQKRLLRLSVNGIQATIALKRKTAWDFRRPRLGLTADADVSLFIGFVLPVMGMTFPRDGAEGYIFKDMSEIMFKNRGIFRASRMEVFTLLVLHSDMLIEEEFHDVEHWSYLLSCWLFIVINSACYFTHRPCMYYNVIFLSLYAATHQEIQRKYSPLELKNLAISSKFSSSFVRHASWYVLVMCLSQKEIKGSAA
nr:SWR1 complex subunit 2 [Tanacetum cinerariifolium]